MIYDAVICLNVIVESAVRLAPDLGPEERAAIAREPEWTGSPWRGGGVHSDADALICGLDKMLTLLGFRSEIGHDDPPAIRDAVDARFPKVARAALSPDALGYKRYSVQVTIDDDGAARWGFVTPAAGLEPPGIDATDPDRDLRLLLQNLARADIATRRANLMPLDEGA